MQHHQYWSLSAVIAGLFSYWVFFSFKSRSPGLSDAWVSYVNMEAMGYFCLAVCALLLLIPLKGWRLEFSWLPLMISLAIVPFLWVLSNPHNLIRSPAPGDFPYLDAIYRANDRTWGSVFHDPWSVLPYDWEGLSGPFALGQLYRTKMPGFAFFAKGLSYIIVSDISYLAFCGAVAVLSGLLLARVLLSDLTRLWPVLGMIPVNTFLIFPVSIEHLCTLFLALVLWWIWRFKQTGRSWMLIAAAAIGAFLILDLAATVLVLPFVILFAFYRNQYWGKMLIVGGFVCLAVAGAVNLWSHWAVDISVFRYFDQLRMNAEESKIRGDELTAWWKVVLAFILSSIVIGPSFLAGLFGLLRRPLCCWTLFFLAAAGPVFAYGYFVPLSEAYRQSHLNCVLATFCVMGMIVDSGADIKVWKILYAGTFLASVAFGKLYAAPVVRLDPFIVRDLAPHPAFGHWNYRLLSDQVVPPEAFAAGFVCFVLILFYRNSRRNLAS